jgi:hypothetical protein
MRAVDSYPLDAAFGCCFVLRRDERERVLDLEVDIDTLPPYGRLCISEAALRCMVVEMGWTLLTPEVQAEHDATLEALSDACVQLDELMGAMAGIVNLEAVTRAMEVAARRVAGKDSIEEWVNSLDKAERR